MGWIKVQGYDFKKVLSTWTNQKYSPIEINRKYNRRQKNGADAAPSRIYGLPTMFKLYGLIYGIKNLELGYGIISI